MARDVVVFERDERYTRSGKPELDFRMVRGILPVGSCPLAIADRSGFGIVCGQYFYREQVAEFAVRVSGYCSETIIMEERMVAVKVSSMGDGVTAEVIGRVKDQYRNAGPEAALAVVKGTEEKQNGINHDSSGSQKPAFCRVGRERDRRGI